MGRKLQTVIDDHENNQVTTLEERKDTDRLTDMLERYGELCNQQKAAKILGVSNRTVIRMMEDGRLRRVGRRVDVRSICQYIEHPEQGDFDARYEKKYARAVSHEIDFYASSRQKGA